jgi:tetratricopeptide (TPR) repeat protein
VPKWLVPTSAIFIFILIGFFVWKFFHPSPPPDECALLAQQQSSSLDIDATVKKIDLAKVKLNITQGQVQEVDSYLKDYGAKYAAACRDNRRKVLSDAEYNCRRDNMDKALDNLRALSPTLDAIQNIEDAGAQKEIVLKYLEDFTNLAKTGYSEGCGSVLSVAPKTLTFDDHYPERSIQVTNGGNRDSSYYVAELPEAFAPAPSSGEIKRTATISVSIKRAAFPVSPGSKIVFYVRDSFGSKVPVEIQVSKDNAELYSSLATQVMEKANRNHRSPTVEDAIQIVEKTFPERLGYAADRYFFAAGILTHAASFDEASRAIDFLSKTDSTLYRDPSTQLLSGLVKYKQGRPDLALADFKAAREGAEKNCDQRAQATSDLFAGTLLWSKGDKDPAMKFWCAPKESSTSAQIEEGGSDHSSSKCSKLLANVERNPALTGYLQKQFEVQDLDQAIQHASEGSVQKP